jgi:hypothetical protein
VEELAFDDDPCIRKGSDGTRYMLGYTISGRYLFVVYALKEKGIARVVKAMDMDEKSRRLSVHQHNGFSDGRLLHRELRRISAHTENLMYCV